MSGGNMIVRVSFNVAGLKTGLRWLRIAIGTTGILMVLGTAGTSDTDPSVPLKKLMIWATIGMVLAYWGFRPYMGDRP